MPRLLGRDVDWPGEVASLDKAKEILEQYNLTLSDVVADNNVDALAVCVLQFISKNFLLNNLSDALNFTIPDEESRIQVFFCIYSESRLM